MCSSVKEVLSGPTTTSVQYTVPNDTQVCYAAQVVPSNSDQDADLTNIQCTTPSANSSVCKIEAITLIAPENNALIEDGTPTFIFIGSGLEHAG